MSDEEDDYMSDAILNQIPDTRPGLLPRHVARVHQQKRKEKTLNEKNKQKPRAVLEKEKRDEGLGVALTSDNKGFSMLQKMGFTPGMALGKKGTGRSEPVPVEVKLGRGGLGHDTEKRRQKESITEFYKHRSAKRQKMEADHKQTFLRRMNERLTGKNLEKDLYNSQKVCEQLDSQIGIKEPHEVFFWPQALLPQPEQSEPEDVPLDKPDHGYNRFIDDDGEDDNDNDAHDDHHDEHGDDGDQEEESSPRYTTEEMLEVITLYLRTKHKYCIWCGIKYTDKDDLMGNCPGPMAELHEDVS